MLLFVLLYFHNLERFTFSSTVWHMYLRHLPRFRNWRCHGLSRFDSFPARYVSCRCSPRLLSLIIAMTQSDQPISELRFVYILVAE